MNEYVLLALPEQSAELVLGMRWHTILGSRLALRARQKAREARASHYAHGADRSEAVGTVRFARVDKVRKGTNRYSGALVFAALHPQGLAAACLELPDGRAWVVAVQSGKVLTHSDKIYGSMDEARGVLDELAQRYGDALLVYGDTGGYGEPLEFAMLAAELRPECRLQPCGLALPAVPRPLAVAALGCLLAFGARTGWDIYRAGAAVHRLPEPVDGLAAWSLALEQLAARTVVHAQPDWNAALGALAALPGDIGGWALRSAQCKPQAFAGWSCTAHYARHARLATNASFLAARPADWTEAWQPLDGVVSAFAVRSEPVSLAPSRLQTTRAHDDVTVTALQEIRPALSAVSLGEPSPLRIDPPRDENGMPIPAPPSLPRIDERAITIEGPLRSLGLMPKELSGQVEWRSIALMIDDSAEPALNRSRLMAGMTGVVYARN